MYEFILRLVAGKFPLEFNVHLELTLYKQSLVLLIRKLLEALIKHPVYIYILLPERYVNLVRNVRFFTLFGIKMRKNPKTHILKFMTKFIMLKC